MSLTIIVGLPGSGKSCYSKKLGPNVYDDGIFQVGAIIRDLDHKQEVIILDPSFLRFIEHFKLYPIKVIVFENEPETCLINVRSRMDSHKYMRNIIIQNCILMI